MPQTAFGGRKEDAKTNILQRSQYISNFEHPLRLFAFLAGKKMVQQKYSSIQK